MASPLDWPGLVLRFVRRGPTARRLLACVGGVAALCLLLALANLTSPAPRPEPPPAPRGPSFPVLGVAETWRRLPPAEAGGGGPLPLWARALAGPLPRTTAAMLELDDLLRERSSLPPELRGRLHWAAARADHCDYAEATALGDLRRAGVTEADADGLPARDRAALAFARKLTRAASTVTDEEVAELLDLFGPEQVVAIVLLIAHANFQDRLLLALGVPAEEDGPLPPVRVRFTDGPPGPRPRPPSREPSREGRVVDAEKVAPATDGLDFSQLRAALERQRDRRPRITLPGQEPGQINWGLVCRTYQPELAAAWSKCGHAYDAETDQDPVFNLSLFWLVTHGQNCFY